MKSCSNKTLNSRLQSSRSPTFWVLPKLDEYCVCCCKNLVKTFEWKSFWAVENHELVNILVCSNPGKRIHRVSYIQYGIYQSEIRTQEISKILKISFALFFCLGVSLLFLYFYIIFYYHYHYFYYCYYYSYVSINYMNIGTSCLVFLSRC